MRQALRRSGDATRYLAAGLRTALPALAGMAALPVVLFLSVTLIALPWLPDALRPVRTLARAERRRAGKALGREIPEPYEPTRGTGLVQSLRLLRSSATWRDLAWMPLHGVTGLVMAVLAIFMWPAVLYSLSQPLWWWAAPEGSQSAFIVLDSWPKALTMPFVQAAVEIAILVWGVPRLARGQARLAELLLRPTRRSSLTERIEELAETRAEALEAHGAELRRIERDLHDGTQAQLVAVALRLGLADRRFDADPDAARTLFLEARDGVEEALTQLRTVIRAIYPPILSDRGLPGAIRALAAGQHIPVHLDVPDPGRAPAAVEAAAYFVVAEALTNIAKHSGAGRAEVSLRRTAGSLRVLVRDDGKGGADPAAGSGLAGIRRRVAALDGTTRLDSPAGRGTTLEVELPCGS
ncbi:sensor histidine kinase [Actinomadura rugatobispora]|uniref:histidine kinase n=1 Tax=Actinomadura rugatobispora TaxID=1994 RepID=A0ABW0ZWI6_9ACTN|nr:sensor histidine kinase [Actinomadura rugatobispora]